jgi:hypothetical protein
MTAASNTHAAATQEELSRKAALQAVQKELVRLDRVRTDAHGAQGGAGDAAAIGERVKAAIDAARARVERADVAELRTIASELSKMEKKLRGCSTGTWPRMMRSGTGARHVSTSISLGPE